LVLLVNEAGRRATPGYATTFDADSVKSTESCFFRLVNPNGKSFRWKEMAAFWQDDHNSKFSQYFSIS